MDLFLRRKHRTGDCSIPDTNKCPDETENGPGTIASVQVTGKTPGLIAGVLQQQNRVPGKR